MPRRLPTTCTRPSCHNLAPCPDHARDTDRDRDRNGPRYTTPMRREAATIRANAIGKTCWRCGKPILPGQRVQAGHTVDRVRRPGSLPDAPEHAACNESAGGKLAHRKPPRRPV